MHDVLASTLSGDERPLVERQNRPDRVSPMLATLTDRRFSDPGWIYERKLDGERAMAYTGAGGTRLQSRNDKCLNGTYPELVEALDDQQIGEAILDGEVVAFSDGVSSFARLQQRMQIDDPGKARATGIAVYYYLFDIVHLGGWCLDRLPLRTRKKLLRKVLSYRAPLRYTAHRNRSGEACYAAACEKGWEGVIAKDADSEYRHGRSRAWLKFTCAAGQELVIGGYTEPRGERKGFGALLVGYYEGDDFRYAGRVGTGYDDEFLCEFRGRLDRIARQSSPFADDVNGDDVTWVTPRYVGEFGFTEWTRDGRLRHPRFLGLRRDKQPDEVVREKPVDP